MKCKICNDIFVQYAFNNKFCKKIDCQTERALFKLSLIKKQESKDWKERKKVIKKGLKTVQELLKDAQVVFNKWIRQRDKDELCISCKKPVLKKANASHYYSSGGHKNVTFDPDNVHKSCEFCNTFLHGNLIPYRTNLIERIGLKRYEALESKANITKKFTRDELRELITEYKQKTK